jgi:hypothetical protein
MRRLIDKFNVVALLTLGAISFITLGPEIDKSFPVLNPFIVSKYDYKNNEVVIRGWLVKQRDCQLEGITAYVHTDNFANLAIPVDTSGPEYLLDYSRPPGEYEWGPWSIKVPTNANSIELHSTHSCHVFWKTTRKLARFYIRDSNGK